MPGASEVIQVCLDLTPLPFLHPSFFILKSIWQSVQGVQSLKDQLKTLTNAIAHLLVVLDESYRSERIRQANTTIQLEGLHESVVGPQYRKFPADLSQLVEGNLRVSSKASFI